jgi:hypothetical protein
MVYPIDDEPLEERLLSTEEVAELLGVSSRMVLSLPSVNSSWGLARSAFVCGTSTAIWTWITRISELWS